MAKHTVQLSNTDREIKGYELKSEYLHSTYKNAAMALCGHIQLEYSEFKNLLLNDNITTPKGQLIQYLTSAGVMHWFTPVYAEALTVEDIKNTDNVGFVTATGKGEICAYNYSFFGIYAKSGISHQCNISLGDSKHSSIADVIKNNSGDYPITAIYRFDTRKELYQWLGQD